jgi:hypothetical protein
LKVQIARFSRNVALRTTDLVQLRKLLTTFKKKRDEGDRDPDLLRNLRQEIFPDLPPLNETLGPEELKKKLESLVRKHKEIERMKRRYLKSKGIDPGAKAARDKSAGESSIEDEEE